VTFGPKVHPPTEKNDPSQSIELPSVLVTGVYAEVASTQSREASHNTDTAEGVSPSPLSAFRPPYSGEPTCDNCGISSCDPIASLIPWSYGPDGRPLCRLCGLHFQLHGSQRSPEEKVVIDRVVSPRRRTYSITTVSSWGSEVSGDENVGSSRPPSRPISRPSSSPRSSPGPTWPEF